VIERDVAAGAVLQDNCCWHDTKLSA
jgi:hypothetical protein